MSFLSLRLPPARKVWKSFTSTLGKLHKIRKSKAMKSKAMMKKRRKHLDTTITTTPATSIRRGPKSHSTRRFSCKRIAAVKSVFHGFYKKPAPVYIDQLFKEPSSDLVGYLKPQAERKPRTEKNAKTPCLLREEQVPGTSEEGGEHDRPRPRPRPNTSDDMWESVAIGSPMMQGIDERAEEFIARFRQEMAAQETNLPRNL